MSFQGGGDRIWVTVVSGPTGSLRWGENVKSPICHHQERPSSDDGAVNTMEYAEGAQPTAPASTPKYVAIRIFYLSKDINKATEEKD